jgi:hypothetical protein
MSVSATATWVLVRLDTFVWVEVALNEVGKSRLVV